MNRDLNEQIIKSVAARVTEKVQSFMPEILLQDPEARIELNSLGFPPVNGKISDELYDKIIASLQSK